MSTILSRTLCGLLLCAAASVPAAELTSSDIKLVALRGDTACLISAKGINWTTSLRESPVAWGGMSAEGYGYAAAYDVAIAPGAALFCMAGGGMDNALTLVDFSRGTASPDVSGLAENTMKPWLDMRAGSALFAFGSWWLGCGNAGLMVLDTLLENRALLYPGIDRTVYGLSGSIPSDTIDSTTAVNTRIIDCSAGPTRIALGCADGLRIFNHADTTWELAGLPSGGASVIDVEYAPDDDSLVYAVVTENGSSPDTALYSYEQGNWKLRKAGLPSALCPAPGRALYVADAATQDLSLYLDTGTALLYSDLGSSYKRRILAGGGADYRIGDVAYVKTAFDTVLVIATDDGIFFSTNEDADTALSAALRHETLPVSAGEDLSEVHATPSILSGDNAEPCRFVYNLAADAEVTIDVFDYNMDHVLRILDAQPRRAGTHGAKGSADVWDGRAGGRSVAPGIYYFRISTDSGTRGFGKIVMARR